MENKKMKRYTENKKLQKSLEIIDASAFDDRLVEENVTDIWLGMVSSKAENIEKLYHNGEIPDWVACRTLMEQNTDVEDELYELLFKVVADLDGDSLEKKVFVVKFVHIFASGDFRIKGVAFERHAKRLQGVIQKLLELKNIKIVETTSFVHNGDLASVVLNLLELYFRHTGYSGKEDDVRALGAALVYDFVAAFPTIGGGLVASLLKSHPHAVDEMAKIIVLSVSNNYSEMLEDISSDMFSLYAYSSDYEYKNAFKILKKCFLLKEVWSNKAFTFMIEKLFFEPLGLDFRDKETYLRYLNHRLTLVTHKNVIASLKDEIADVQKDYEGIQKQNWMKAYKRVAVAKTTYNAIELVLSQTPQGENAEILQKLFNEATRFKNAPKLFDLNTKPTTLFKDFGLKLLVIEELMYNQKVLKPMFTLDAFAQEYTKKEINKQSDSIITEVKKFYTNLEIPTQLLKKVVTLYQDSGMSGGAEIYNNMIPLWDPGCGDEVIKVKLKAVDDLDLLPNLKKVIGFENSKISKKFIAELKKREIALVAEET